MNNVPRHNLVPAAGVSVRSLSDVPRVLERLEQLHSLVVSVCPNCLVTQRGPNDDGVIYVPSEREHAKRNKNLLTMWAEAGGVRMRIMPDPEEMYDPSRRSEYATRLHRLYAEMLGTRRKSPPVGSAERTEDEQPTSTDPTRNPATAREAFKPSKQPIEVTGTITTLAGDPTGPLQRTKLKLEIAAVLLTLLSGAIALIWRLVM